MKITTRQFAGFKKAAKEYGIGGGISYNDNWNLDKFGITYAQYHAIRRCCADLLGIDYREVTHANLNKYLAGEKVHLTRVSPDLLAVVEEAFRKR
jgi:hypothetical protein